MSTPTLDYEITLTGAATAEAGKALGLEQGRFTADGTGVDVNARARGEHGGAPHPCPASTSASSGQVP